MLVGGKMCHVGFNMFASILGLPASALERWIFSQIIPSRNGTRTCMRFPSSTTHPWWGPQNELRTYWIVGVAKKAPVYNLRSTLWKHAFYWLFGFLTNGMVQPTKDISSWFSQTSGCFSAQRSSLRLHSLLFCRDFFSWTCSFPH